MCGRFYVPEDDSIQMIRTIVEYLEHRNVKAKTGDVFPGDMAAVLASNRQMQPQPFAMEWGVSPLRWKTDHQCQERNCRAESHVC